VTLSSRAEHAPAKVNLALHVVGQRTDGYHLLESLAVFTRFGDSITVEPTATDEFSVTGQFAADVPATGSNLVIRARDAFRKAFPDTAGAPFAIELDKHMPVASGIGGGSSDAAATLRAMAAMFDIERDDPRLTAIAAGLGADVPMCLAARPTIARGIGEQLQPVAGLPPLSLVLVNPGVAVATPAAFAALAQKDNPPLPAPPVNVDASGLADWLAGTRNDLSAPAMALAPQIGDALAAIEATRPLLARMSGSGATCFGLFADAVSAESAARTIAAQKPGWFVTATQTLE